MHQKRFLSFIKQSFQGAVWIFLISMCFAGGILLTIALLRESNGEVRRGDCAPEDFIHSLNLIAPMQLGISHWDIGDSARYQHRQRRATTDDTFNREIGFQIIGELERLGSRGYWLKKTGLSYHQKETIPMDLYHWVTVEDLRITSPDRCFEDPLNYFPSRFMTCNQADLSLARLVELGITEIETKAGIFECIHYFAELGWNNKTLEIWVSPAIPPLGIVRAESKTDILELISFGQETEISIPRLIKPIIDGISTLSAGCNSCHGYDDCHEMFFPPR